MVKIRNCSNNLEDNIIDNIMKTQMKIVKMCKEYDLCYDDVMKQMTNSVRNNYIK